MNYSKIILAYRDNQLFQRNIQNLLDTVSSDVVIEKVVFEQGSDVRSEKNTAILTNILNSADTCETLILVDGTCKKAMESIKEVSFIGNLETDLRVYENLDNIFQGVCQRMLTKTRDESLSFIAKASQKDPKRILIVLERVDHHKTSLIEFLSEEWIKQEKLTKEEQKVNYTKKLISLLEKVFPGVPITTVDNFGDAKRDAEEMDLVVVDRHVNGITDKYIWERSEDQEDPFGILMLPTETGADYLAAKGVLDYKLDFAANRNFLPWAK